MPATITLLWEEEMAIPSPTYLIAVVQDDRSYPTPDGPRDGRYDVLLLPANEPLPVRVRRHERLMIIPHVFLDKKEAELYMIHVLGWTENELKVVEPRPF